MMVALLASLPVLFAGLSVLVASLSALLESLSVLLASLSVRSFPLTKPCPGQYTHSLPTWTSTIDAGQSRLSILLFCSFLRLPLCVCV